MEKLFAACAPGLEPFTALELDKLGLLSAALNDQTGAPVKPVRFAGEETGGVSFTGDLKSIYLANLHLRTASRVLVRMGEFYAAAFSELRKKAGRLAWERYLKPGQPVTINVSCHRSRIYHSDAVAERIVGAIGDCLGRQPQIAKSDLQESHESEAARQPPQLVVVRLVHDLCTISVDSSGELLHRRGYRLATAKAPLRETLAAGMLLASEWDRISPLIDPFCGSGTIPIEAVMMALGIAPGRGRRFAFMDWQNYEPAVWEALLEENSHQVDRQESQIGNKLIIFASDRDAGAIQMSRDNASRIGVEEFIKFSCQAVSAIEPTGPGWVVTNPPYGLRVSANKDLRNLYAQFGKVLKEKCPQCHVAILCNDYQLLRSIGLQLDTGLAMVNGGIAVRLARGIVAV
jgi:putative N6-adenine-specific DNA methylase